MKHFVLVVCGDLGLFDDVWLPPVRGQARRNRASFPSALSGIRHYINRKEGQDRGRLIRALCEAYSNLCQDTYNQQDLADEQPPRDHGAKHRVAARRLSILMWFSETNADSMEWVELGSAEFEARPSTRCSPSCVARSRRPCRARLLEPFAPAGSSCCYDCCCCCCCCCYNCAPGLMRVDLTRTPAAPQTVMASLTRAPSSPVCSTRARLRTTRTCAQLPS